MYNMDVILHSPLTHFTTNPCDRVTVYTAARECTLLADCDYSPNWLALQCLRVRTVSAIICWKASRKQVSGRVTAGAAQVACLLGRWVVTPLGVSWSWTLSDNTELGLQKSMHDSNGAPGNHTTKVQLSSAWGPRVPLC